MTLLRASEGNHQLFVHTGERMLRSRTPPSGLAAASAFSPWNRA